MSPIGMTLLFVVTLTFFSWSVSRRMRQLRIGQPDPRLGWSPSEIIERTGNVLRLALGQEKMWKKKGYAAAGIAHIGIFAAFNILLLNSLVLYGRGFDYNWSFFWDLLSTDYTLGRLYSFAKESAVLFAIAGCVVFWMLRINKKGKDSGDGADRTARMTLGKKPGIFNEPNFILFVIASMMFADVLYVGAHEALRVQGTGESASWHWYEPIGSVFAMMFQNMSFDALKVVEHSGFWWHAGWTLLFLNILPYSKHFHVLTVMPKVYAADPRPAALPKVEDLEGKVEREESLGINTLSDLTHSHILDLYTCTECGRCSDNCPAFLTDKVLSPKHLTLALRDHLYASEGDAFKNSGVVSPNKVFESPELLDNKAIKTYPPAPIQIDGETKTAQYLIQEKHDIELVPNVLSEDVIWSCTTCRACEEQCPVTISYVDKIVGMRRELVMMKAEFPHELQTSFRGMETNGNPWNMSAMDRGNWADGLGIPMMSDAPDADVLYWVGCAAAYDDRAKKVARALSMLLQEAGVNFAILGTEETCTGDPARRAGNEFLFQMLAEQNVETLNGYDAHKRTIITACPHCFNTLANEYPDFGGKFDVVHHSDFLNGLLVAGKLKPSRSVDAKVVYHDSCYLGRYNQVYDSPRRVLEAIDGVELTEVEYYNKEQGLCCGAGGAQYWKEEEGYQNKDKSTHVKVNSKRTLQLLDTGATTIASGCPFCQTMLTDGVKEQEKEDSIQQLDIAELLAKACNLDYRRVADAAE